jgi:hypothetical protein
MNVFVKNTVKISFHHPSNIGFPSSPVFEVQCLKGSVSRDVRGVKSGINREVFL